MGSDKTPAIFARTIRRVIAKKCSAAADAIPGEAQIAILRFDPRLPYSITRARKKQKKNRRLHRFQINANLMKNAPKHAITMHCLPAYCGTELDQAPWNPPTTSYSPRPENRLRWQKGLSAILLSGK